MGQSKPAILSASYSGISPEQARDVRARQGLSFSVCLGVWAWERAIEKREYIAWPGHVFTGV